jgi:hypothetical protein
MALDMLVGKDEDGDLISLWVDRRCFEPMPEEVLRRGWRLGFSAFQSPKIST